MMFQAGFARLDITLPLGTGMAGYFEPRYATDVRDPLSLNAIAFSDGEQTSVLITVDALGMRYMFCDEVRALIEEKAGVPADHVIINALHQHTSFVMRPKGGTCALEDKTYIDVLYRKFADVAKMAVDDLTDATLFVGVAPATVPLSFIRRYRMKDGSVKTNPSSKYADQILGPAGKSDNDVRLLRFVREGKKEIALVNFCTHPDVIGGYKISADWPGFVRRFVEEEHGVHCLLVNGFQGDVNHINFQIPKEERFPAGSGYKHCAYMGRVIADTVNLIWDKGEAKEGGAVRAAQTAIYNRTRTDGAEDYDVCKPIYDEFMKTFKIPEDAAIKDLAYLRRVAEMRTDPIWRRVPVSAIAVGDIAFVGLGGEPFSHYGEAIREGAPDKMIITCTCANGFEGYLPTAAAFEEGGYEATASAFTSDLEEQCVGAAVELLKNL